MAFPFGNVRVWMSTNSAKTDYEHFIKVEEIRSLSDIEV